MPSPREFVRQVLVRRLIVYSSIMERLSPVSELWRLFRVDARIRIRKIKEDVNLNAPKSRTTVFHELLTSDLPDSEKEVERMGMEAQSLVGAGIETVTWCKAFHADHDRA